MSKAVNKARVVEVADEGRRAIIDVQLESSCGACAIAQGCDKKPKGETVEVEVPVGMTLNVGDEVEVSCPTLRYRGMLWNVALPCGVLIAAYLVLRWAGAGLSPQATAGTPLLALAAYYIWLLMSRRGGNKWRIVAATSSSLSR